MNHHLQALINAFIAQDEVHAIALGGSRSTGRNDHLSDYDLYVYLNSPLEDSTRVKLLSPHCSYMEIGNTFWEPEDNCILMKGDDLDIIYRNIKSFIQTVANVAENHRCSNGNTTSRWHNLVTCEILYDPSGNLKKAQKRFSIPYPETLRINIVQRNMKLLTSSIISLEKQMKRAVERQDLFNINNRVTLFLGCYFDIIFAINRELNPGEKRIIPICMETCSILPSRFKENIEALLTWQNETISHMPRLLDEIVAELKKVIEENR